jgi:ribosomal protein L40E
MSHGLLALKGQSAAACRYCLAWKELRRKDPGISKLASRVL